MSKNVFRPMEVVNMSFSRKVRLEAPKFRHDEELEELVDVYDGPTSEDLRQEAELFKQNWEKEKLQMIQQAQSEAQDIKEQAEKTAFEELRKKTDEADLHRTNAQEEAERIISEAKVEAERIIVEAQAQEEKIFLENREAGEKKGHQDGFAEGSAEVQRLVDRLHTIINAAIEKRSDIINEAESQLIDLVLLISSKVVKVISENQKNVVINNVVQALRKLKSRGNVAIRVNLADLALTTDNVQNFMKMVENVKSIVVLEDTSVDKGGCVIETDFGQIDARISSQLKEIEEKILELTPIQAKGEQ
ncbi:MAG: flagellar assembly protein FliH [Spirochaetaceae bacterium]|nr:flagellar assembly protein FliH [Spirochaetaceae bacterium]